MRGGSRMNCTYISGIVLQQELTKRLQLLDVYTTIINSLKLLVQEDGTLYDHTEESIKNSTFFELCSILKQINKNDNINSAKLHEVTQKITEEITDIFNSDSIFSLVNLQFSLYLIYTVLDADGQEQNTFTLLSNYIKRTLMCSIEYPQKEPATKLSQTIYLFRILITE